MDISNRQIKLLQFIIDEYTLTAQPVSSKVIVDKYFFNLSPQTIRNEMLYLEKIGLLEKTHTSSGRIPSLNGYKFYEMNILKPYLSNDVKNQLKVIFQKRDLSIDMIINESASLIEEILKLPTVVASQDSNILLKRFDLIPITDQKVLLLLVTSNGDVIKNDISITNNKELDDVIICVKIFNDRLIDTPLNQITQKLSIIKEIIRCSVHEYEFVLQKIIKKIFDFNTAPQKHQVYGVKSLMSHPEFQNVDRLKSVLSLLDNASVWKHISFTQQNKGKTIITFGSEIGEKDLTIASTTINSKNSMKQISVVGPTRMNYAEVKGLLDFIKEELEKITK